MPDQDPYFTDRTLELARESRDRHGVSLEGTCLHCPGGQSWPCLPFQTAQRTIDALTDPDPGAGFLRGDEYLQAAFTRQAAP